MKRKKIKIIGLSVLALLFVAGSIGAGLWFKPHRDVQATRAFAEMTVSELVNEFNKNSRAANAKYLSQDGNSKVITITGRIHNISTNQDGETVILLKDEGVPSGVLATFSPESGPHLTTPQKGDLIKVKGAITAGNSYDADLDLYEHAVLIHCDLVPMLSSY